MIFASALGFALLFGFSGSWHCGAMCGPISTNFKTRNEFWTLQLTRLLSYWFMTGLAFFLVHWLNSQIFNNLQWMASLIMGLMLIAMGFWAYKNGRPTPDMLSFLVNKLSWTNRKKIFSQAAFVGLLTGLFPCGWFYSFLLMTPQVPHFYQALILITVFWMTSLPALAAFRGVVLKMVQSSPGRYQKMASIVLVFAGVLSILGQWSHILARMNW